MDAIRVPRPPRLVPIRRETPFSVNPDNRMAAGTLLITWLARTETITSCPVIILESRELTAGMCFRFPMKMKNPIKVRMREKST